MAGEVTSCSAVSIAHGGGASVGRKQVSASKAGDAMGARELSPISLLGIVVSNGEGPAMILVPLTCRKTASLPKGE